jgi:hypothetical protein
MSLQAHVHNGKHPNRSAVYFFLLTRGKEVVEEQGIQPLETLMKDLLPQQLGMTLIGS